MRLVFLLSRCLPGWGLLLGLAACTPYQEPPPPVISATTIAPPPIVGTVVVQPQP